MAVGINVEDFCKDTARALLILSRAFPRPHTLFVEDLCGPDDVDDFGMHSDRHVACFSALLWLAREGYLHFADTIRQEAVDQAVLSGRAFTLLCTPVPRFAPADAEAVPEALRLERQTHLYRIESALEDKSSTRLRTAVLELMGAMEGLAPPG